MRLRITLAALIGICLAACASAPSGTSGSDRTTTPDSQAEN